jgi:hypothetical protein
MPYKGGQSSAPSANLANGLASSHNPISPIVQKQMRVASDDFNDLGCSPPNSSQKRLIQAVNQKNNFDIRKKLRRTNSN